MTELDEHLIEMYKDGIKASFEQDFGEPEFSRTPLEEHAYWLGMRSAKGHDKVPELNIVETYDILKAIKKETVDRWEWNEDKVIDFVNWYLKVKKLPFNFELENQEILDSFKRGDEPDVWHNHPLIELNDNEMTCPACSGESKFDHHDCACCRAKEDLSNLIKKLSK